MVCRIFLDMLGWPLQEPYKSQLEPMILRYVVPAFGSVSGHLRGKACWVTAQFADVKWAEGRGRGASFQQLFRLSVQLLSDPDLPVCPQIPRQQAHLLSTLLSYDLRISSFARACTPVVLIQRGAGRGAFRATNLEYTVLPGFWCKDFSTVVAHGLLQA